MLAPRAWTVYYREFSAATNARGYAYALAAPAHRFVGTRGAALAVFAAQTHAELYDSNNRRVAVKP